MNNSNVVPLHPLRKRLQVRNQLIRELADLMTREHCPQAPDTRRYRYVKAQWLRMYRKSVEVG